MNPSIPSFEALLFKRKSTIVAKWLRQTLQTYPEPSVNFLSQQPDPFRNPVGHTLKEGLSTLFDGIVRPADGAPTQSALDAILRIRAVQDVAAGRAISFLFLLKRIIKSEFPESSVNFSDELAAVEIRIDEMTLLAFDVYVKCREQIAAIKSNESRRMSFLAERIHLKSTAGAVNVTR